MTYESFLRKKLQYGSDHGFEPHWIPEWLFDFQRHLLDWTIRRGRAAVFADCGLGKTPMQLVWSENVRRETGKPTLILTPLAVASQTAREAAKFDIGTWRSSDGSIHGGIVISNYERLHYFSPKDFGGVALDESSILKSFDGKRKAEITEFMRTVPYRSLWTATAAPNDYVELGTSSEALGELGHLDMLGRFFVNCDNTSSTRLHKFQFKHKERLDAFGGNRSVWRFKGHAETPFWRWVCSWALACRRPSDLGFADDKFILPELIEREHVVKVSSPADGYLFAMAARNFAEERAERRRTVRERCEMAEGLTRDGEQAVIWCHLNDEGDLLAKMIPGAVQVSGTTTDDDRERAYLGFADGTVRVLIIKPRIGAFGMNWQNCAHVITFVSHSYEQYYQAVRRCWRFGQKRPVVVDLIASEGEVAVKDNLRRKAEAADKMFSALIEQMSNAEKIETKTRFNETASVPAWMEAR